MEAIENSKSKLSNTQGSEESWDDEEVQELVQTLSKERNWYGNHLYFYQGFWCTSRVLRAMISFQKHFQALDNDIFLTSLPKCGTTWMKALIFTIVNRNHFELKNNPLLSLGPHQAVPYLELDLYLKNHSPDLENIPQPRIFSTHTPYASLPPSIKECSTPKIVYICRNPMDMFISYWHFTDILRSENVDPLPLDEAFEMFCQGIHGFGPFPDHVLGYWKAKQENPNNIMFLKYEDLKKDIVFHVKKLANFLGFPFSKEEERQGEAEEIAMLCSFENLKGMEVNKSGKQPFGAPNTAFFRKGEVGDWSNYLTPSMVERLQKLVQEKLNKSDLTFKYLSSK
ncbi:hypothetical protein QUC31_009968 [Theobroma cacao]|uniref:Sulfotransferase n=1 Tax=Theobroma cacao TaxID=3641 RepID=A0A061F095_THECC|nr:Sulfotransferase 2A, putative [Theobroma cacao]